MRLPSRWAPSATCATSGGRSAFQNFLTGNADGSCTAAPTLRTSRISAWAAAVEPLRDVRPGHLARESNVTLDYGVRYSLYPPVTEVNNRLATFNPDFYDPAKAPKFTTPAGTLVDMTTGSPTNGIMIAGQNSPYGDAIYKFQKGSIQPRVGLSWDPDAVRRHDCPGLVRHLLRPAAGRHLRVGRLLQSAVQHQHQYDRAVVLQSWRRHDANHAGAGHGLGHGRGLQEPPDDAVERRREPAALREFDHRGQLRRGAGRQPDPSDRPELPDARRRRRAPGGGWQHVGRQPGTALHRLQQHPLPRDHGHQPLPRPPHRVPVEHQGRRARSRSTTRSAGTRRIPRTTGTRSTCRRTRATPWQTTPGRAPTAGTSSRRLSCTPCRSSRTRRTPPSRSRSPTGRSRASCTPTPGSRSRACRCPPTPSAAAASPTSSGTPTPADWRRRRTPPMWFDPAAFAPPADGTFGQLGPRAVPPAGLLQVGPGAVEELLSLQVAPGPVPGGLHQRVQPGQLGIRPDGDRPRQHVHDERHVVHGDHRLRSASSLPCGRRARSSSA